MFIPTEAKAIKKVKEYNSHGIKCSLSFLPIRHYKQEDIDEDDEEYLRVLRLIDGYDLDCDVTIKLEQFGSLESYDLVYSEIQYCFPEQNPLV